MTVKKQRDVGCLSLTREQERNIVKRGQHDGECAFVRERQVLEEAVRFPFSNQQVLCIQQLCIALNWNKCGPRLAGACWGFLIKSCSKAAATKISSFLPCCYSSAGFSLILCLAFWARSIPSCLNIIRKTLNSAVLFSGIFKSE